MLNIAAYVTPLTVHPDPNGAAANLTAASGNWMRDKSEKARLEEQGREADQRNALGTAELGQRKVEHNDLMEEHRTNLHTKLIDWGMGVLDKEGPDKARQIVGPVWGAAGIDVDFGDFPPASAATSAPQIPAEPGAGGDNEAAEPAPDNELAELEAADRGKAFKAPKQDRRGSLDEYLPTGGGTGPKPGESLSAYVSRNTTAPKAAKPTEKAVEAQATEGPDAAAQDEAKATVAQAPKPWKIIDRKTGRVLGVIDPQKVESINRERAARLGEAYVSGTPESGKPIVQGFEEGARDEADVENRMEHAEKAIAGEQKNARAALVAKAKGGPGQIGGPIDEKLLNQVNGQVRMYVSKAADNSGVKLLNQHAQSASQIAQMIDSASSGAQRQAFATQLHANFGAASSEGERAFQLEQGGKVQALLAKVDAWVNSGQLPPGLKEEISAVAHMQAKFAQEYAQRVRDQATKDAMDSPALGGLYDRALGHKLTPEERKKISDPVSNLGGVGGEGESSAEPGSADQEFDKLGI